MPARRAHRMSVSRRSPTKSTAWGATSRRFRQVVGHLQFGFSDDHRLPAPGGGNGRHQRSGPGQQTPFGRKGGVGVGRHEEGAGHDRRLSQSQGVVAEAAVDAHDYRGGRSERERLHHPRHRRRRFRGPGPRRAHLRWPRQGVRRRVRPSSPDLGQFARPTLLRPPRAPDALGSNRSCSQVAVAAPDVRMYSELRRQPEPGQTRGHRRTVLRRVVGDVAQEQTPAEHVGEGLGSSRKERLRPGGSRRRCRTPPCRSEADFTPTSREVGIRPVGGSRVIGMTRQHGRAPPGCRAGRHSPRIDGACVCRSRLPAAAAVVPRTRRHYRGEDDLRHHPDREACPHPGRLRVPLRPT